MARRLSFTISQIPRCRWNVVDMVTIVGRQAARAYMFFDVDMTWATELRKKLSRDGEPVTFTAIFLKAIATAQRSYPQSLQSYLPFNLRLDLHEIAAGFTIERMVGSQPAVFFGLIDTPERKTLPQIAVELKAYAEANIDKVPRLKRDLEFTNLPALVRRAILKLGMVCPPVRMAVSPATFGLTSLGKYGTVAALGPCICACTFGIGTIEDRAVVRSGQVVVRPIVTLALSYDVRIIDDVPAAMFMREVKNLLEGGLEDYKVLGTTLGEPLLISTT